jgi:CO dehydrogenase maturation factor
MRTRVGKIGLVVNRVRNGLPGEIGKAIKDFGLDLIAVIPEDPNLSDLEIQGKPIIALPEDSPLRLGAKEIIEKAGM